MVADRSPRRHARLLCSTTAAADPSRASGGRPRRVQRARRSGLARRRRLDVTATRPGRVSRRERHLGACGRSAKRNTTRADPDRAPAGPCPDRSVSDEPASPPATGPPHQDSRRDPCGRSRVRGCRRAPHAMSALPDDLLPAARTAGRDRPPAPSNADSRNSPSLLPFNPVADSAGPLRTTAVRRPAPDICQGRSAVHDRGLRPSRIPGPLPFALHAYQESGRCNLDGPYGSCVQQRGYSETVFKEPIIPSSGGLCAPLVAQSTIVK